MEDNIQEMYRRARKAFEIVEFWPQEKVDEMVAAVGWEWQKPETAKALSWFRMALHTSYQPPLDHDRDLLSPIPSMSYGIRAVQPLG